MELCLIGSGVEFGGVKRDGPVCFLIEGQGVEWMWNRCMWELGLLMWRFFNRCGPMMLDVLLKVKDEMDPTLVLRRSCR